MISRRRVVVGSRRSLPEVVRRMRTAMPEVAAEYAQLLDSRARRLANDRRFSGDCVSVSSERRLTSCVSNLQQSTSRDHVTGGLSRDCIRYFSYLYSLQRNQSTYRTVDRFSILDMPKCHPSFANLITSGILSYLTYLTIRAGCEAIACVDRLVIEGQALHWTKHYIIFVKRARSILVCEFSSAGAMPSFGLSMLAVETVLNLLGEHIHQLDVRGKWRDKNEDLTRTAVV